MKKHVILFFSLLNIKNQLFLMCLFLCFSRISLGDIIKKNQKWDARKKDINVRLSYRR